MLKLLFSGSFENKIRQYFFSLALQFAQLETIPASSDSRNPSAETPPACALLTDGRFSRADLTLASDSERTKATGCSFPVRPSCLSDAPR